MYTLLCLCIYIFKLYYSEKCRNDNLLYLRRNGQGIEVSTQNQVKAAVTEVCLHQACYRSPSPGQTKTSPAYESMQTLVVCIYCLFCSIQS